MVKQRNSDLRGRFWRVIIFCLLAISPHGCKGNKPSANSPQLLKAVAIAAAGDHACALTSSGLVTCWGINKYGMLGSVNDSSMPFCLNPDPPAFCSATPLTVGKLPQYPKVMQAKGAFTCVVTASGGVKCWGSNNSGALGNGTFEDSYIPQDVKGLEAQGLQAGVKDITTGCCHACAITASGGVKCWGYNNYGQLGKGDTGEEWCATLDKKPNCVSTPVQVAGLTEGVVAISAAQGYHTCALTSSGGVKCWGLNTYGQLGNGTNTGPELCNVLDVDNACSTTPVDVVGLGGSVRAISAGWLQTCALLVSGGVKCWGGIDFDSGLGGTGVPLSITPVDVPGLTSGVSAISVGYTHACALMSYGGVKCWGANHQGQLGNGTTETSATPVDVSGLTEGVTAVSAGRFFSCAILANGGVKCWGRNKYGQLGLGNDVHLDSGPEDCFVNGKNRPCSRTPVSVIGFAQ